MFSLLAARDRDFAISLCSPKGAFQERNAHCFAPNGPFACQLKVEKDQKCFSKLRITVCMFISQKTA